MKSDFYRYLQLRNHFENNIKNKTDFDDPILKIFIGAYQGVLNKGAISKFLQRSQVKKKIILQNTLKKKKKKKKVIF